MIACPAYLKFGSIVEIENKQYVCEDRMAKKYRETNHFDILMFSNKEALEYGRQSKVIRIIS